MIFKIILVVSALCLALISRFSLALLPDRMGDITVYRSWAERVDKYGINSSYFQNFDPPIDYPPLIPDILGIIHKIYQKYDFSYFEKWCDPLNFLIRMPATISDIIISLILFLVVKKRSNFKVAYFVMLAYGANPAIILNTAYWGQTDALHSLFLVLSIICLVYNKPELSWGFITLGVFTKPLTWPFIPLILFLTVRDYKLTRLPICFFIALSVALIILFPFIYHHNLTHIIARIITDLDVMPSISLNAHNIWWICSFGPPWVSASIQPIPGLSFRLIGIILFSVFNLFTFLKFYKMRNKDTNYLVSFSIAFAFFMVVTHMHENHMFAIFPLLAMIYFRDRRLTWVYGLLSITFLLNIILHDPFIMIEYIYKIPFHMDMIDEFYTTEFMALSHRLMTIINSLVNTVLFVYVILYIFMTKNIWCDGKFSNKEKYNL